MNNEEKPKTDETNNNNVSTYESRAIDVIGPRNVGKTFTSSKYLKKEVTKDLFIK